MDHEKDFKFLKIVWIICCLVIICCSMGLFSGCRTTNTNSPGITDIAVESERSIARVEFINQQLGRISERERRAIEDLQSGSGTIEDIFNELFAISFRLLDEIDDLRQQLSIDAEMGN